MSSYSTGLSSCTQVGRYQFNGVMRRMDAMEGMMMLRGFVGEGQIYGFKFFMIVVSAKRRRKYLTLILN